MELLMIGWSVGALVGILIARSRNRAPAEGCAWGCLLGPIGWVVLALMAPKEPQPEKTDGG